MKLLENIGLSDSNFSKLLRYPISSEQKEKILKSISKLVKKNNINYSKGEEKNAL